MEKKKSINYLDPMVMAKVLGQPLDPRKPFTKLETLICDMETVEPGDYYYNYDALLETDKIIVTNTASGLLTQESVSADSPSAITFVDYATPEYYINIGAFIDAKEDTIARKKATITRAMDEYEDYKIIQALETAANSSGNDVDLESGATRYNYSNLVDQIDQVTAYGDEYVLLTSATIDKDIRKWNWNDNKYHNLMEALADLNIKRHRIHTSQNVTVDGSATPVIGSTKAYLVANRTELGKCVVFVRKKIDHLTKFPGVFAENEGVQRLIFSTPTPVPVGGSNSRQIAIGLWGFMSWAVVVRNIYGISRFERAEND